MLPVCIEKAPCSGDLDWLTPEQTWGDTYTTSTSNNNYKPKRLTTEEKKLQRELYDSITTETMTELGHNEMVAKVRKDYGPNPDAKGYKEPR
jgi:hypothetical protein